MKKVDVLSDIDAVLSDQRVIELDRMLDVVFEGGRTCTHSIEEDGDYQHQIHDGEGECGYGFECDEEQNPISDGFRSWYNHPVWNLQESIAFGATYGKFNYLEQRATYIKNDMDYVINVTLDADPDSDIMNYAAVKSYAIYCLNCAAKSTMPMRWDAWLFLYENPEFGLDGDVSS